MEEDKRMTQIIARTTLIVLLLPLGGAAIAQTAPPPPPSAANDGQPDGSMTLAQFQAAQAQRMMAADTDGDGRISQAEWTAQMSARSDGGGHGGRGGHFGGGGGGGGYDPARAFARFDTNGDGFIDKAEIDAASAARFQRMDTNGDGILTPDERAAMRGGMHRGGDHGGRGGGQQDDQSTPPPPSSPQP